MVSISVWNPKGGVGKSTLSINLAGAMVASGKTALISDLDPQGSSVSLSKEGKFPFDVVQEIPKTSDIDIHIIDHPPGFSDIPTTKVVVFPLRPSRPDMEAGIEALRALKGRVVIPVLNDVDTRRADDLQLIQAARKMEIFKNMRLVKSRTVFRRAYNQAVTIFDESMNGVYAVKDARLEIKRILARSK